MKTIYNVEKGEWESHEIIAVCESRKSAILIAKKYNENPNNDKYHDKALVVESKLFEDGDVPKFYRLWTTSAYINIDGTVHPIDRGYSIGLWNFEDNFELPPTEVEIEKWGRDGNGNIKVYMRSNTRKKVRDYLKKLSNMSKSEFAKIGIYIR